MISGFICLIIGLVKLFYVAFPISDTSKLYNSFMRIADEWRKSNNQEFGLETQSNSDSIRKRRTMSYEH